MVIGFFAETYANLTTDLDIIQTPYIHIFWRLKLSQLGQEKSKSPLFIKTLYSLVLVANLVN